MAGRGGRCGARAPLLRRACLYHLLLRVQRDSSPVLGKSFGRELRLLRETERNWLCCGGVATPACSAPQLPPHQKPMSHAGSTLPCSCNRGLFHRLCFPREREAAQLSTRENAKRLPALQLTLPRCRTLVLPPPNTVTAAVSSRQSVCQSVPPSHCPVVRRANRRGLLVIKRVPRSRAAAPRRTQCGRHGSCEVRGVRPVPGSASRRPAICEGRWAGRCGGGVSYLRDSPPAARSARLSGADWPGGDRGARGSAGRGRRPRLASWNCTIARPTKIKAHLASQRGPPFLPAIEQVSYSPAQPRHTL